MSRKLTPLFVAVAAAGSVAFAGVGAAAADPTPPDHHSVICQTATFYAHYAVGSGPFDPIRTLTYGNDVGHTDGKQGEQNGWAYSQDFGPNDWGWIQRSCLS